MLLKDFYEGIKENEKIILVDNENTYFLTTLNNVVIRQNEFILKSAVKEFTTIELNHNSYLKITIDFISIFTLVLIDNSIEFGSKFKNLLHLNERNQNLLMKFAEMYIDYQKAINESEAE